MCQANDTRGRDEASEASRTPCTCPVPHGGDSYEEARGHGLRSIGRRITALAAGVGVLGVVLSGIPAVLRVEETLGLGALFLARGPIQPPADVLVVSLSAESAEALGLDRDVRRWPRSLHAELLERLSAAGAAAIAMDIVFEEERRDDPEGDLRLARAIEKAGNVILAERVQEVDNPPFVGDQRFPPAEPLRRAALATAPFMLPYVPTRVSQSWTFGRAGDAPSLPAVAMHAYALPEHGRLIDMLVAARPELAPMRPKLDLAAVLEHGLDEVMRGLRVIFRADAALGEDLRTALRESGDGNPLLRALIELYAGADSRYLNYYGPLHTIETLPFHEALLADPSSLHDLVDGRVVFVGFSESRRASQQRDVFVSIFSDASGHRMAGVEVGATLFANLLYGNAIRPLPIGLHWTVVAIWGLAVAAVSLLARGFAAVAVGGLLAGLFAVGTFVAFRAGGLWGPLVVPLGVQLPAALLVGLSWNHNLLRKQRERIHKALGYYVPTEVVERLANESLRPRASRELVHGTCLVSDIERYTTVSETLHPTALGELMDAYYDVLVQAVDRYGGIVSDIGGDSMIAVWPAASSVTETRAAALSCALHVLEAADDFNELQVHGKLPTRIGLDSGQLLLGNVGARVRGEFRAVGDIVNTAARLQGLNRLLGTRILVSAAAGAADGFVYRPLGRFLLVGKRTPVTVLELQAVAGQADASLLELDAAFSEALAAFTAGEFARAEASFAAILERFPNDRASRFYLEQCRVVAAEGGEWDGIVRVTVK